MALLSILFMVLYFATKSGGEFVSVVTDDDGGRKTMVIADRITGELQQINSRLTGLEIMLQQTDRKVDSSADTSNETKKEILTIKIILNELLTHCKTTADRGLTTDEEEAKVTSATAGDNEKKSLDDVRNSLVDLSTKLNETMQRVVKSLENLDDVEKEVNAVKGLLNSTTNGVQGLQGIGELDNKLNAIAKDVVKQMYEVKRGVAILDEGWNNTEQSLSKLKNIFNQQLGYCYRPGHECPLQSFSSIPLPNNEHEVTIPSQECQEVCDAEPRCNSYNTRSKRGRHRCDLFEEDCAHLIERRWSGGYFVRASSLPRVLVAAMGSSSSAICRAVGDGFRPSPRGIWKGV